MTDSERHNAAILPILRLITEAADSQASQWVLLETLCLAIGKLHGCTPRQTAEFVEAIAERLASGKRD